MNGNNIATVVLTIAICAILFVSYHLSQNHKDRMNEKK